MPVRVWATDLHRGALDVARRGVYPEQALRDLPERLRTRYFEPLDALRFLTETRFPLERLRDHPLLLLAEGMREVAAGNLNFTIKLRKNDDLQDLAADMNLVVEELREFVKTLKDDHETLSVCIGDLEKQIENRSISAESGRELIDKMETSRKMIALTLDKYSLQ